MGWVDGDTKKGDIERAGRSDSIHGMMPVLYMGMRMQHLLEAHQIGYNIHTVCLLLCLIKRHSEKHTLSLTAIDMKRTKYERNPIRILHTNESPSPKPQALIYPIPIGL